MVAGPLATSAKVFGGLNAAGLAISLAADTHVHLDLIGTGAYPLRRQKGGRGDAAAARAESPGRAPQELNRPAEREPPQGCDRPAERERLRS